MYIRHLSRIAPVAILALALPGASFARGGGDPDPGLSRAKHGRTILTVEPSRARVSDPTPKGSDELTLEHGWPDVSDGVEAGEDLPSGEPGGIDVESCSVEEFGFGNVCCKVVSLGGDLNPMLHFRNVTGVDLPAGAYIAYLLPHTNGWWQLQYPLPQGQWTAGPPVTWEAAYSEEFGDTLCVAGANVDD